MLNPRFEANWLVALAPANPKNIYLRNGELVVYKRPNIPVYQCRFKLADGSWHRVSTKKLSLEHAIPVACDLYNEARYTEAGLSTHSTDIRTNCPVNNQRAVWRTGCGTGQSGNIGEQASERCSLSRCKRRKGKIPLPC